MKKLILLILLLMPIMAFSQTEIKYNSTPTIQWDYSDVDENGDPWLPEDIITFEVYLWDTAQGEITEQPLSNLNYFGTTALKEMQLSFTNRYNWAVAVRSRVTDGAGNTTESDLAYSTVSEDSNSLPFVYAPNLIPALPKPTLLQDSGI